MIAPAERRPGSLDALYRIAEQPDFGRIFLCATSGDADALIEIGLAATAIQGDLSHSIYRLAGREVVIVVAEGADDHDDKFDGPDPLMCAVQLSRLEPAARVKILRVQAPFGIAAYVADGDAPKVEVRAAIEDLADQALVEVDDSEEVEGAENSPTLDQQFLPFPTDCLPPVLRDFVRDQAAAIGVDESFIALPILTATAAAIGTTRRIKVKGGWVEVPIIWTVIVGNSGSMKSPGTDRASTTARRRQARAAAEHAAMVAKHKRDLREWKAADKATRPSDPPEEPPPAERTVISDVTIEAVADRLSSCPRGLLLVRDELSGWIGSWGQYKKSGRNGDAGNWLEMHGGRPLIIDRSGGPKVGTRIPHAAIWVAGGIQPQVLRRLLTPEMFEGGMAARLMFAWPPRRRKRWTEAEPDDELQCRVDRLLERLYSLTHQVGTDGDPEPSDIPLDNHAKINFAAFVNEVGEGQFNRDDDEENAAWSKLEGAAARLALVLHLVRWADGDDTANERCVDHLSVAAGITLAKWFGREAARIYQMVKEEDADRDRRQLRDFVLRKGGTVTVRELYDANKKHRPMRVARERLGELVTAGIGYWVKTPGAAMSSSFRLNTA